MRKKLCGAPLESDVHLLRTRSSDKERDIDPGKVKLGVVARLRREVAYASSNQALAVMVEDFKRVTIRSNGRTITKVIP